MRLIKLLAVAGIAAFAGYARYPERVFELLVRAQRRLGGLTAKTIEVDGHTWHYLEGGDPFGEPLVLIHGFAANKDNWCLYARGFHDKYRIICPDLLGFGDTERDWELDYDGASQADRLVDFLRALGIDRAHVGGNSMGGMITLQVALRHPELPKSLALLDSAGTSPQHRNEFWLAVEDGENPLAIREPSDIDRLLDLVAYKAPKLPERLKMVFYRDAKERESFHDMVFDAIAAEGVEGALDDQVADIGQATLILWGKQDRILDVSCTELLSERIPRNRVEILDHTGHAPMVERPRLSSRLHDEFLTDVAAGRI